MYPSQGCRTHLIPLCSSAAYPPNSFPSNRLQAHIFPLPATAPASSARKIPFSNYISLFRSSLFTFHPNTEYFSSFLFAHFIDVLQYTLARATSKRQNIHTNMLLETLCTQISLSLHKLLYKMELYCNQSCFSNAPKVLSLNYFKSFLNETMHLLYLPLPIQIFPYIGTNS